MANRYELAYIYARVCGALARSWNAPRIGELARNGKLSDAWRAIFEEAPPALPEGALVDAAERRAIRGAFDEYKSLVEHLEGEEPFFTALRRKAEFARVKRVILALRSREEACPESDDPSLAPGFDAAAYPEVERMFSGGRYGWITKESLADIAGTENRLDRQYYEELWDSLLGVRPARRGGTPALVLLDVELSNVVWAQRLARYYGMEGERIRPLLVDLPGQDLVSAALEGAAKRADKREDWAGWKYEFLLGEDAGAWMLDVRGLELAARRHLYARIKRALHLNPFTYTPLYCFFKLKEFETVTVLSLFEGISLGAPEEEISYLAPSGGGAA